jgi:hypothetical protein
MCCVAISKVFDFYPCHAVEKTSENENKYNSCFLQIRAKLGTARTTTAYRGNASGMVSSLLLL